MKQRILTTMLIAAMATAGCSKSDTPADPSTPDSYVPSTTEIAFATTTTKAYDGNDFRSGDTFGVYGYYYYADADTYNATSNNKDITSTTELNFMTNQEVSYDGSLWSYSPIRYWSTNLNDAIEVIAYAPYDEDGITDFSNITFEQEDNVADHKDFMTSSVVLATNGETPDGVAFQFVHQLTKVNFAAKLASGVDVEDDVKIVSITLSGIKRIEGGSMTEGGFTWGSSYSNYTKSYTISQDLDLIKDEALTATSQQISDTNGAMLIHPQPDAQVLSIEVIYTLDKDTYVMTDKVTQSVTVDATHFKKGQSNTIEIELTPSITDDTSSATSQMAVTLSSQDWDGNDDSTPLGGDDTITGEPDTTTNE